jgi:hypothetical protein
MVSCLLLGAFPASLIAADMNAAMLHTSGAAWINGGHLPRSSAAIFAGDLLQTRSDSVASITQPGSSITILSDSLVEFEGSAVRLDHGGLTVATSKGVAAHAGDATIMPASNNWTEFNVVDVDGTLRIAARKGDLTISDSKGVATLTQGQETTREDSTDESDSYGKKKKRKHRDGAAAAASGGILNHPIAVGVGAGAVAGLTAWVLLWNNDDPVSPSSLK